MNAIVLNRTFVIKISNKINVSTSFTKTLNKIELLKSKEIYKELKATLIILSVIGLFFLVVYLCKKNYSDKLTPILSVYFILSTILMTISSFFKNKYLTTLVKIIAFPFGLIYAILIIILPFWTLLVHLIFYFSISIIIPLLLFRGLHYFHLMDFINRPTEIYLKITLTVFICVLTNSIIRDLIYRIAPSRVRTSEKMKPYELEKLTDYFLSIDNIKFLIYAFYVIALLTTNCYNFQGKSFNSTAEIDKSILQSFVTFIAFDRVLTLLKALQFSPAKLLSRIYQSISNKIETDIVDNK